MERDAKEVLDHANNLVVKGDVIRTPSATTTRTGKRKINIPSTKRKDTNSVDVYLSADPSLQGTDAISGNVNVRRQRQEVFPFTGREDDLKVQEATFINIERNLDTKVLEAVPVEDTAVKNVSPTKEIN